MKYALIALVVFSAHAPLAAAQPAASHRDPADPAAPVPALQYQSAFEGYRGFRETPLAPWRDVNDEVARVGGHLGVLRGQGSGREQVVPGANVKSGDAAHRPASR